MDKGKQKATDNDDWKWDPVCKCWRGKCLGCYDSNTDCVSINPPEYLPSDIPSKDLKPGESAMIWGACDRCVALDLFCDHQVHLFLEKGHVIPWHDCPIERWLSPSGKEVVEQHTNMVKEAKKWWEDMDEGEKARAKKHFEEMERTIRKTRSSENKVNVKKQIKTRKSSRVENLTSLSETLIPDLMVKETPPPSISTPISTPSTPATPALRTPKSLASPPAIFTGLESPLPNMTSAQLKSGPFSNESSRRQHPRSVSDDKVEDGLKEEKNCEGILEINKSMTDTMAEVDEVRKQIDDLKDGGLAKKKKNCCKHKKGKRQEKSG